MRIGITTSVIQGGKTGIAQYLFALLRALLPFSARHEFFLFILEQDLPLFEFLGDQMRICRVPESWRPPLRNILWHQAQLPRLARALQLDVIHVPSYRRMSWSKVCASVATIHDLAPFHVKNKYDPLRMFYGRVVARRLAHCQDAIIAISRNTALDIQHFFGIPTSRTTVVHNGVEHARFFPENYTGSRDRIKKVYGLKKPFFLFVARLEHPAKNHVRLIEAFNRFKGKSGAPWELVLGGSDWHGAEVIHEKINRSPYRNAIRPIGFVPDSDLPDLYRAANVFAYPSLFEGFGMPPVEAMACGCPVIASARGSLAEVLGDAACIVDPEDAQDIASKMELLAGSREFRESLRNRGLSQAKQFDWSRTAAQTLAVYGRAAKRTLPNPAANFSFT